MEPMVRAKLPDPPLLVVTDRRQARMSARGRDRSRARGRLPLDQPARKGLPADEQILSARALLPMVHRYGAVLTLHGDGALARLSGVDGVYWPAAINAAAGRADIGAEKLLGVSIHTAREARAIDPSLSTMRSPGPHSRPRASPVTVPRSAPRVSPSSRLPQPCRYSPRRPPLPSGTRLVRMMTPKAGDGYAGWGASRCPAVCPRRQGVPAPRSAGSLVNQGHV